MKYPIKVRHNEVILKRPINTVVLPQRVHFRDRIEQKQSNNGSNNLELLFFLSEHNNDLYYGLSNNKALTGRWVNIYNEIIIAAASVVGEESKDEVMEAQFALATVHRSMDTSHFAELSLRHCCVSDSTAVKEKFKDVTNSRRAGDVTTLVLAFLEVCNCLERVAVMASGLNREHAKVKMKIRLGVLILCYPHLNLNVALNQRAARMRGCQIFFSHLTRLSDFFFPRSLKPM